MHGSRLLVLVAGSLALVGLVAFALFRTLSATEGASATSELAIELGPAEDVAAAAPADERALEAADASRAELERTRVAEHGRTLDVAVALPAGAPPDPGLAVVALPPDELDDRTPGDWLAEHGDETPAGGGRAPVGADGRARLTLPDDGGELTLFVDGRFLYGAPVTVAPDDETARLEAELGACLLVRIDVESGGEPAGDLRLFGGVWDARNRDGFDARTIAAASGGEVVVGGLNADFLWTLVPDLETHHAPFTMGLELEPGEEREHRLTLRAGASVSGVVVDADGRPVEGARVRSQDAGRGGGPWGGGRDEGVRTDADGRFELRALRPGQRTLSASAEGWRETETDELELLEGQRIEDLTIALERGLAIEGVVVWGDGRGPAAGAKVVAATRIERRAFGSMSFSRVVDAGDGETDEDGRFALRGLDEGTYQLRASCADPATGDEAGGEAVLWRAEAEDVVAPARGVELRLAGPLVFAGRVVDDRGEPVTAFELAVESTQDGGPEESQAFKSEDGTFTFARVGAGEWRVEVEADGHVQDQPATVTLPHDGTPVELVLLRTASVRGRVLDTGGHPVADALVIVDGGSGDGNPWRGSSGPETETDAEGRFLLEDQRPGGLALTAAADDWADSEVLPLELQPGQELADATLFLRVGGRIEGVVVTPEGEPIPGQRVSYGENTMGFGGNGATKTDGAGRFAFEHVTPGEWSVTASPSFEEIGEQMQADGASETTFFDVMGQMISKTVVVVDGETVQVYLGGEPKRPVRVFGVVERDGEPLVGAQVFAVAEGKAILQGMKAAVTDEAGRYELTVDRPGAYVVSARLERQGVERDVDVPRADEVRVDLFVPLGRIEGTVLGPDGRPLGGARLAIQREDGLGRMRWDGSQAVTDDRGRYAFEDLEAGVYTVRANVAGFGGGADGDLGSAVRSGLEVDEDRATTGVDFRLTKAGRVEGVVRGSDGQPVARASVFFRDEAGRLVSQVAAATTDATGRFEQDGLAPGVYLVSVRSDEHASNDQASVTVRSGEASEVELAVETGTIVKVKLVDPDGLAKRSRVEVFDRDGTEVGGLVSISALQALFSEGSSTSVHEIGPLPPGRYRVVGTLPDGTTVDRSVRLRGEAEKDVVLKLD